MKIRYGLMSGLVLCFLGSVVFGQAASSPGVKSGVAASEEAPAPVEAEPLPVDKFDSIRLDDFLDFLKQKVTGFNSVIVRAPGVPTDYPTLPSMTTKNVTIGQFLEFIKTSYPGVNILRIDGPKVPLYVIRIGPADGQMASGIPPGSPGLAPGAFDQAAVQVMVFQLGKIIDNLTLRTPGAAKDQKKALDDVLSLVEAAMKEQSGDAPPTLQVHEATQTLLFKGTPSQMNVLVQVLQTLQPTEDDVKKQEAEQQAIRQEAAIDSTVHDLRERLEALKGENIALRAQLDRRSPDTTQTQK